MTTKSNQKPRISAMSAALSLAMIMHAGAVHAQESQDPATIHRAMRYSLFAGGKRVRPLLAIAAVSLSIAGSAMSAPQEPVNDKCPVCSKTPRLIFHSNDSKGQRVAFASADCKDKFDKSPTKYTVKPKG